MSAATPPAQTSMGAAASITKSYSISAPSRSSLHLPANSPSTTDINLAQFSKIEQSIKTLENGEAQKATMANTSIAPAKPFDLEHYFKQINKLDGTTKACIKQHLEGIEKQLEKLEKLDPDSYKIISLQIRECLIKVETHNTNGNILVKLFKQCEITAEFAVNDKNTFSYVVAAKKSIIKREIETYILRKQITVNDDQKDCLIHSAFTLFGVEKNSEKAADKDNLPSHFTQQAMVDIETNLTTKLFVEAIAAEASRMISIAYHDIREQFHHESKEAWSEQTLKQYDTNNNTEYWKQLNELVISPLAYFHGQNPSAIRLKLFSRQAGDTTVFLSPHWLEHQEQIMKHFKQVLGIPPATSANIVSYHHENNPNSSKVTILQLTETTFDISLLKHDGSRKTCFLGFKEMISFIRCQPAVWKGLPLEQQCNMIRYASLGYLKRQSSSMSELARYIYELNQELEKCPETQKACIGIVADCCIFCTDEHINSMSCWLFQILCTKSARTDSLSVIAEKLCQLFEMREIISVSQSVNAEVQKIMRDPQTQAHLLTDQEGKNITQSKLLLFAVNTGNTQLVKNLLSNFALNAQVTCPNNVNKQKPILFAKVTRKTMASTSKQQTSPTLKTDQLFMNPNLRDPLYKDTVHFKPLISIAAAHGYKDIVTLLLAHEDMNASALCSKGGRTPFHAACCCDSTEPLKTLLSRKDYLEQHGITLKTTDEFGILPFHIACFEGHLDVVTAMIQEQGKQVIHEKLLDLRLLKGLQDCEHDIVDLKLTQPLCQAAIRQNETQYRSQESLLKTLSSNAAPSANSTQGPSGGSAVHCASYAGKKDIVSLFVNMDPEALTQQDNWQRTALHIALELGHVDLALELITLAKQQNQQDIFTHPDINGNTAYHLAAKICGHNLIQEMSSDICPQELALYESELLAQAAGANVSTSAPQRSKEKQDQLQKMSNALKTKNSGGQTPFACALSATNESGAITLIEYGVGVDITQACSCPVITATSNNNSNGLLAQLLGIEEKVDGTKDKFAFDDTLFAMCKKEPMLLTQPLDPNKGDNIFHYCCKCGRWYLLEKLIEISANIDLNTVDSNNDSVLSLVCHAGKMELVKLMMTVHKVGEDGVTPLKFLSLTAKSKSSALSLLMELPDDDPNGNKLHQETLELALEYAWLYLTGNATATSSVQPQMTMHQKYKQLLEQYQPQQPTILTAVRQGNVKTVQAIIAASDDPGYEVKDIPKLNIDSNLDISKDWADIGVATTNDSETEQNPLHIAVEKQDLPLLKALINESPEPFIKENEGKGTGIEFQKTTFGLINLVNEPDEDGLTPLHRAKERYDADPDDPVAREIYEYLFNCQVARTTVPEKKEQDIVLLAPSAGNPNGDTPYHKKIRAIDSQNDSPRSITSKIMDLVRWLSEKLKFRIGSIINFNGENIGHVLIDSTSFNAQAQQDMSIVFKQLLEDKTIDLNRKRSTDGHSMTSLALLSSLSVDDKRRILEDERCNLTQKIKGQSLLHIVAANGDQPTLTMLIDVLNKRDTSVPSQLLTTMLCSCDREKNTPLHLLLSRQNPDYASVTFLTSEITRQQCTKTVLEIFNNANQSIIHLAAQCTEETSFTAVVNMVTYYVHWDQVKTICKKTDEKGFTPIQYACSANHPKPLLELFKIIEADISTELQLLQPQQSYLIMAMKQYAFATSAVPASATTNKTQTQKLAEQQRDNWKDVVTHLLQLDCMTKRCMVAGSSISYIDLALGSPPETAFDHALKSGDYSLMKSMIEYGATPPDTALNSDNFLKFIHKTIRFFQKQGNTFNSYLCSQCIDDSNLQELIQELKGKEDSKYRKELQDLANEAANFTKTAPANSEFGTVSNDFLTLLNRMIQEYNDKARGKKIDINEMNENGKTPLLVAGANNSHNIALELVRRPECDITKADKDGKTIMHWAAQHGDYQLMYKLVQKAIKAKKTKIDLQALLTAKDSDGNTPLHLCSKGGHRDCVALLINEGITTINSLKPIIPKLVAEKNNNGEIALHCACQCAEAGIITRLIYAGSDITCQNTTEQQNPLHVLVSKNSAKANGIYPFARNNSQAFQTALSQKNKQGVTPVELAVKSTIDEKAEMVSLLFDQMVANKLQETFIVNELRSAAQLTCQFTENINRIEALFDCFFNVKIEIVEEQPKAAYQINDKKQRFRQKRSQVRLGTPGATAYGGSDEITMGSAVEIHNSADIADSILIEGDENLEFDPKGWKDVALDKHTREVFIVKDNKFHKIVQEDGSNEWGSFINIGINPTKGSSTPTKTASSSTIPMPGNSSTVYQAVHPTEENDQEPATNFSSSTATLFAGKYTSLSELAAVEATTDNHVDINDGRDNDSGNDSDSDSGYVGGEPDVLDSRYVGGSDVLDSGDSGYVGESGEPDVLDSLTVTGEFTQQAPTKPKERRKKERTSVSSKSKKNTSSVKPQTRNKYLFDLTNPVDITATHSQTATAQNTTTTAPVPNKSRNFLFWITETKDCSLIAASCILTLDQRVKNAEAKKHIQEQLKAALRTRNWNGESFAWTAHQERNWGASKLRPQGAQGDGITSLLQT